MADFSDHFRKITIRYKRIGCNINVMRQPACLVIKTIAVDSLASLFNCTPVVVHQTHCWPNKKLVESFKLVRAGLSLVCCLVIPGSTSDFLLLRGLIGVVSLPRGLWVSQYVVSVESSSLTHYRSYS